MRRTLFVVLAVAVALFLTNPGRDDLAAFLEKIETRRGVEPAQAGRDAGAMAEAAGRANYQLWSVYRVEDRRYLGLVATFFIL